MQTDVTFLGVVRRVVGAKVFVEISQNIPSANPIIHGRVYRIGQIGSFVRIPLGFLNLFGVVSMVGASELSHPEENDVPVPIGQRWIEVQLVGESYGHEGFQRGVSVFPTLDDEVHIVAEDDLSIIYGNTGPSMIEIGTLAASESLPAFVDLNKIVTRHAAIVGSTGSGKSNTVAALLRALTSSSYPSARIVVIDPHGEYASALEGKSKVYSIGNETNPLFIPYWAMSFDELGWFLIDRKSASESVQDSALRDVVFDMKKAFCAITGQVDADEITVDSPVPFSIKKLWYHFDRKDKVTYLDMARTQEALIQEGDPETLTSASFQAPGAGSSAPFKPTMSLGMGSYLNKILGRLKDRRFDFLLSPGDFDGYTHDLDVLVKEWVDHEHAITVLDLGGVPFEIMDLVVGLLTRILYENMFWGRDLPGVGRDRPLLMFYEEAHAYLPKGGTAQFVAGYASRAVRRIFKEGRKYGIGAIVVSQRPSELDETALSQCGTFIALRLSNSDDQGRIKSIVPDSLGGLVDLLPALRTGEALVLGESVKIPSRVRLPLIEPRPKSDDPDVSECWAKARDAMPHYKLTINGWRRQKMPKLDQGGSDND